MTYNPNIPLSSSSPSTSASQIQVNFAQYAAIFSRSAGGVIYNHMPFNNLNQGKHAAVIIQNQTADPKITTDNTILYVKNATSVVSTEPQIFVRIPIFLPTAQDTKVSTNLPMQVTYNTVSITPPIYQSFLIGGYLIYFGIATGVPTTITLTPKPSKILTVQIGPQALFSVGAFVTQPDKFLIQAAPLPPALTQFTWMVIAKA